MFEKFLTFAVVNITILIKQSMILIYDINKTVKHWQWDWSVVNRTHKQLSELFLVEGNNTSKNYSCCFSKRRQRGGVCMQNNTLRHYGNRKERGREKSRRQTDDRRRSRLRDRLPGTFAGVEGDDRLSTNQGERSHESLNTWAKLQGSMPNYETFIRPVDVYKRLASKTRQFLWQNDEIKNPQMLLI